MVWQRAGTVSVQNGSTTVTGAGVDFAASSRVGDSFVGPDGATYEVANVASATVISILPAYKGATVSGAAYAIMPVQGYDKMLSDAFNSLNNQFGPKLAALGTTGNYDILPVTKGGTGGANAADAQSGLKLKDGSSNLLVANFGVKSSASSIIGINGGYVGWGGQDYPGFSGDMNFVCNRGAGSGGFTWRSVNLDNTASGPVMSYSYSGILSVSQIASGMLKSSAQPSASFVASGAGLYLGYNESGYIGESNFICNNGATSNTSAGGFSWRSVNSSNSASGPTMRYIYTGDLSVPGTVSQGSDRRLKINDVEILNGLEKILKVRPVEFDRRSMITDVEYPFHESGVIAQELFEVLPILVTPGSDDPFKDPIWRVNYTGLIPYLISAIKELSSEVEALKAGNIGPD